MHVNTTWVYIDNQAFHVPRSFRTRQSIKIMLIFGRSCSLRRATRVRAHCHHKRTQTDSRASCLISLLYQIIISFLLVVSHAQSSSYCSLRLFCRRLSCRGLEGVHNLQKQKKEPVCSSGFSPDGGADGSRSLGLDGGADILFTLRLCCRPSVTLFH